MIRRICPEKIKSIKPLPDHFLAVEYTTFLRFDKFYIEAVHGTVVAGVLVFRNIRPGFIMKQVNIKSKLFTECYGKDSISSIVYIVTPFPQTHGG